MFNDDGDGERRDVEGWREIERETTGDVPRPSARTRGGLRGHDGAERVGVYGQLAIRVQRRGRFSKVLRRTEVETVENVEDFTHEGGFELVWGVGGDVVDDE